MMITRLHTMFDQPAGFSLFRFGVVVIMGVWYKTCCWFQLYSDLCIADAELLSSINLLNVK